MKITIEFVGSVVRVEIDNQEIAVASQGEAAAPSDERVSPERGSAGANAGGNDVTSSVLRAPVEATEDTNLAGGLGAGIDHSFIDGTASGPDVKRAPISAGSSNGRTLEFDSGNAGSSPAPASNFILKLWPHCQHPEACGGYGDKHCHACHRASEVAA